ncbi:non-ribosomal peptide synthetase [Trichocoleus sp. ST-U3]|uniref:non-ribosomal peptide synthetase n=1 Tax=Coleofasciculus sp. FACHB-542 TaxID=2692787 RepID=UPI00168977CD|nr:non-ribosomal peptide synthetase [Coleofasciculus sp. FACHB-542]MBD2083582.1 amino acid adenylation domain-containing protein [Coleofasciculus sp. FACHB-542]
MNNISQRIAALSPEQRALLELRLKQKGLTPVKTQAISQRKDSKSLPLSFHQQRLWVLHQLEPDSPIYNVPIAIRLTGFLNVKALEQSLNQIRQRHEVLQTRFRAVGGQAVQEKLSDLALNLPVIDLRDLPENERQQLLEDVKKEEAQRPFDLSQEPLLRVKLLQLSETEHLMLFTMHHIVSDGWSRGVIIQELAALYEAFSQGKPSPLPELPIQYADFAAWQRQQLVGEVLETQLNYWKQQLTGASPILELPTNRPRPTVNTFKGARQFFTISQPLALSLRTLSQQSESTLFMTLLAAFNTLLYRYTGQEDISIGAPMTNRSQRETENLIGFFVNTLVLRTLLSENISFRELLARVREVALQAYAHQDLSFERLVEELQPSRDRSYTPLFQVMFALHTAPKTALQLPGLSLSLLEVETGTAKFDLTLEITDTEQGLTGSLEYNTDLFDEATITRMLGHFQTLLEGIVANPDRRLSDLPLLMEAERYQLLVEWNQTQTDYPADSCFHQLFEQQVEKTPDAIALTARSANALAFEEQHLTYKQLNERANQLANYLQKQGITTESLVGICVERSLEMMVGLIGILKAGGAYVPLDPSYPQERLSFMLSDAQMPVLLTQQHLVEKLPHHTAKVICLDAEWDCIAQESIASPAREVNADNLAYVIYTSGSTGKPKGTLIPHRGLVNYLSWCSQAYAVEAGKGTPVHSSLSFDMTITGLFSPLLVGNRVILLSEVQGIEALSMALRQGSDFSLVKITPAQLDLLRHQLTPEEAASQTKAFIIGGENLLAQSLEFWQKFAPDTVLVNEYGPTETVVGCCIYQVPLGKYQSGSIPIGRPIANTQLYILDKNLQPVPIGVIGELHIGGAGVARGYLNRPELTAEKFIPNPFKDLTPQPPSLRGKGESGSPLLAGEGLGERSRLYKTGDLARYRTDGTIEYLGRCDRQIKLRGFRIELEEIESVLAQHPQIRDVVVLIREDESGPKLVAYVVPKSAAVPTVSELRSYLQQKLPEYSIPSAFVTLESLPLTPNGKVDRQGLPSPGVARPNLDDAFVAPRTPAEQVLAEVWREVLNLEQVGIHDNFFALGGDSIRSIQVRSLVQNRGLNFSIQQLFQYQTISELAPHLEASEIEKTAPVAPFSLISEADRQKLPNGIEDAYPLTKLQAGMLFHSEYSPETAVYHDIVSFQVQATFDLEALRTAIKYLISRHAVLRTCFDLTTFKDPLQLVHQTVEVPLQVEDWRHSEADALTHWFEIEKSRNFDWTRPPLLKFHVHRRSEATFQLTLSFHHAILDGWSVASLFSELFQQYSALLEGEETLEVLPSPVSHFRDFVSLEREAIASEECRHFWSEKLKDSTITKLPRWFPPTEETHQKKSCAEEIFLSSETSSGLKQLAESAGVPLKSVLLAAHLRVLSLLSGQSAVLTGLVSNGRLEKEDGEKVIGLFLNTLPFCQELPGGTWIDLVKQTFASERELLPFRRYPLPELQKVLNRQLLFETAFNFTHFHVYESFLGLEKIEIVDAAFFEETNFALIANFVLNPVSDRVQVKLEYQASFSQEEREAIRGYYAKTLEVMVSQPSARYELSTLLSEQEQHQLLVEWNDTQVDYPKDACLHQLFAAQVEKTPDNIAVVFEGKQLTYRELNQQANQVAHRLQKLGVKTEVLVGICMERSLEMVVGLLGILKAGAAYVPLDPFYPPERLAFMLEDAGVPVLLTQQHLVENLPKHNAQVLCLDTDWEIIAQESLENPSSRVTAENLAYVIYTSGSTGTPKGGMNTHRGICNRLLWMQDTYQLTQTDRVLQKTPFSFDVSVWEFFWPLITGSRLVVAKPGGHQDSAYLVELIAQEEITTIHFVPPMLQIFLEELEVQKCQCLKRVICSGEALSYELQQRFFARLDAQLHNLYGPTEAAIDVTYWACQRESELPIVPIGRAIANTQLYILDRHLQPVPVGVPGELHIGGVGLARGYLNRPDLTQQKFIPNPFKNLTIQPDSLAGDSLGESRLYKTGDLARYLPDGNIEFLGRIDNQVKLRGFRIELGEIEAALMQHPAIRETVVLLREDNPGDKRLVAYIVPKEQAPDIHDLRDFLKQKLPSYMVPSAFMFLEALPLTANGKIERRALPAPKNLSLSTVAYIPPRNPFEEKLAQLWAEVLDLERVGIHDNFFELGGNSLVATQLISKVRRTFQVEIPLRNLFELPTIAGLAESISQTKESNADAQEAAIQPIFRTARRGSHNQSKKGE